MRPKSNVKEGAKSPSKASYIKTDIFNFGPVVNFQWKFWPDASTIYVSPNVSLFGYCPNDFIQDKTLFHRIIHPDDLKIVLGTAERTIRVGQNFLECDYRIYDKHGNIRWVHDYTCVKLLRGEKIAYGLLIDITDRVNVEQKLKQSELEFRTIFQNAFIGVAQIDLFTSSIIRINKAFCEILGYSENELATIYANTIISPADLKALRPKLIKIKNGEIENFSTQLNLIRKDKTLVWSDLKISGMKTSGAFVNYLIITINDISEKKKLKKEAREAQLLLQSMMDHAPFVVFAKNEYGDYLLHNNQFDNMFSITKNSIPNDHTLLPDYVSEFYPVDQMVLKEEKVIELDEMIPSLGKPTIFHTIKFPIKNSMGNTYAIGGIALDITEKRSMEEKLKFARLSIDNSIDAIFWVNEDSSFFDFNQSACALTGLTPSELQTACVSDVDPTYPKNEWPEFWHSLKERKFMKLYTTFTNKLTGVKVNTEINVTLIEDGGKECACAIVRDITKRKEIEQQLINSESKFKSLITDIQIGVILQNLDGEIILTNKTAQSLLGLPAHDLTGKRIESVNKLINQDGTPLEFNQLPGFTICKTLKPTKGFVAGVIDINNNEIKWLQIDSYPIFGSDNIATNIVSTFADITEERDHQTDLKNIIHEKETLIKEIHHRVKNNLQLISSLLQVKAHASETEADIKIQETFQGIRQRIKSIALIHERLLQSKSVNKVNIADYLGNLITDIEKSSKSPIHQVRTKIDIESHLFDIDTAISCGLITNELLVNSFKYAFTIEKEGLIEVSLMKDCDYYELMVKDNGKTLPEEVFVGKRGSFGMELLEIFTHQIKGSIEIHRNNGTEFVIRFPNRA